MTTKKCKACGVEKKLGSFYKKTRFSKKRGKYIGISVLCKKCTIFNNGIVSRQSLESLNGKKRLNRILIAELKKGPCVDCGQTFHPVCMDFDHLNPETKTRNISAMAQQSKETILAEIAKCELVCANCHRLRSSKLLGYFYEKSP